MSTNTIPTTDMITSAALVALQNDVVFLPTLQRYDGYFDKENKIGASVQIRVPSFYATGTGPAITTQGIEENTVVLVANQQIVVPITLTDQQKQLQITDMVSQYIAPATAQLASAIDSSLLGMINGYSYGSNSGGWVIPSAFVGSYTGYSNIVTPGSLVNGAPAAWTGATLGAASTGPASANIPFNEARAYLVNESTPGRDLYAILSPNVYAAVVPQMTTLFNDREIVSESFKEGTFREYAGAIFKESALVPSFTSGTWVNTSAAVNTSSNTGDTSIILKTIGDNAVVNQGDCFVIAGSYAVNRLTGGSYNYLRIFTATAAATASGSGTVTISVSPAIIVAGAGVQGPTVSALPAANAVVTFLGTANTTTQTSLFYWKDSAVAAFPPLPTKLPGATVGWAEDPNSRVSLRMSEQFNAQSGQVISRLETLFGGAVTRPQNGVKLMA